MPILALGVIGRAAGQAMTAPQWRTLATDAYPEKRDDIVFADALTGFYGTGKGQALSNPGRRTKLAFNLVETRKRADPENH
jgi:hypothetical protein